MVTISSKKSSKYKIAKIMFMVGLFFQTHSAPCHAALSFRFAPLGSFNKGCTVRGSARPPPKFFFHFVPEKLRISLTLNEICFSFYGLTPVHFSTRSISFFFLKEGGIWCFLRFAPKTIFCKNYTQRISYNSI